MTRRSTLNALARLMLAWYVVFLAAGTLSPVFKPVAWAAVCSASGTEADAGPPGDPSTLGGERHLLDCPLCLPWMAPPSAVAHSPSGPAPAATPALVVAQDPVSSATGQRPPARGPPAPHGLA